MTKDRKMSVFSYLKEARNKAIRQSARASVEGNLASKADWQRRKAFIESLYEQLSSWKEGVMPPKRVFVSYSKSGTPMGIPGTLVFQKLREALDEKGFEVVSGFSRAEGDQGEVLRRVLRQLKRSTVFVGVFTKALEMIDESGRRMWAPGVWLMEEKGMALAMGKTYVWMIEKDINFDYWFKTTPTKVSIIFDASNLDEKINEAVIEIENRYNEQLEIFARVQEEKGLPIAPEFSGLQR